jgi:hypothetical protein
MSPSDDIPGLPTPIGKKDRNLNDFCAAGRNERKGSLAQDAAGLLDQSFVKVYEEWRRKVEWTGSPTGRSSHVSKIDVEAKEKSPCKPPGWRNMLFLDSVCFVLFCRSFSRR